MQVKAGTPAGDTGRRGVAFKMPGVQGRAPCQVVRNDGTLGRWKVERQETDSRMRA